MIVTASIIINIGAATKFKIAMNHLPQPNLVIIPPIRFVGGIIARIIEMSQGNPKYALL